MSRGNPLYANREDEMLDGVALVAAARKVGALLRQRLSDSDLSAASSALSSFVEGLGPGAFGLRRIPPVVAQVGCVAIYAQFSMAPAPCLHCMGVAHSVDIRVYHFWPKYLCHELPKPLLNQLLEVAGAVCIAGAISVQESGNGYLARYYRGGELLSDYRDFKMVDYVLLIALLLDAKERGGTGFAYVKE